MCIRDRINEKLSSYIKSLWRDSELKSKYFQGNIRLTYLVYSLGMSKDITLVGVRTEAELELQGRQFEDGGWPEYKNSETFSVIDTAFSVVALSNSTSTVANDAARKGALKLVEYYKNLPKKQLKLADDAIVYAAVLQAGMGEKIPASFIAGAIEKLVELKSANAIRVYHFDFERSSQGSERSRDYLCVPHVFLKYLISSGLLKQKINLYYWVKARIQHSAHCEELSLIHI